MDHRGFTLIELMVALAILATLSGIAYPSFQQWRDRDALNQDVMVLKGAVANARSRSVQRGMYWGRVSAPTSAVSGDCTRLYYGVHVPAGADGIDMVYFCDQDGDGDVDTSSPDEVHAWATRALSDRVTVTGDTTIDYLWFNKGGSVFSGQGSVYLEAGGHTRKITVSNSGRLRED